MRLRRHRVDGHSLTCRRMVQLVTDYLDGALRGDDRRRFEAHLRECDGCTEHLRQIEASIAMTGRLRKEDIDPAAREQLITLYRSWRNDRD